MEYGGWNTGVENEDRREAGRLGAARNGTEGRGRSAGQSCSAVPSWGRSSRLKYGKTAFLSGISSPEG